MDTLWIYKSSYCSLYHTINQWLWLFGEEKEHNCNLLCVISSQQILLYACILLSQFIHHVLSADTFSCVMLGRNPQAGPQAAGFPGQSILSDPMSNLAMAYGSSLASQGREMVDKNVRVTRWYFFWMLLLTRTDAKWLPIKWTGWTERPC